MSTILTTNLMTKRDASNATGISIPTITRAVNAGELPAEYQGGRYSILPADLYRYAELMADRNSSRMYPLYWIRNYLATFHGYHAGEG